MKKINLLIFFLFILILFFFKKIFIVMETMKNNKDKGYFHQWYNWDYDWGFPWRKCNPLKKEGLPIYTWYWY